MGTSPYRLLVADSKKQEEKVMIRQAMTGEKPSPDPLTPAQPQL